MAYGTDEDASGPDPTVRRYDLSSEPIDWARNQIRLVEYLRSTLLGEFVEDGDTWGRARQGYQIALNQHVQAVSAMANWVGGARVYRDKKGDPEGRQPIDPIDADVQREALEFVIDHTFYDDAFGLTPELLRHMTIEKWGLSSVGGSRFEDNTLPVHDQVLGVQASAMTMLLNPTTLRRVHDNMYLVDEGEDVLSLAELMGEVKDATWEELGGSRGVEISTLRQNLQREHVDRLIDLINPDSFGNAAAKPVAALASLHLRQVRGEIEEVVGSSGMGSARISDEVNAHLTELHKRIGMALDAQYIYNAEDIGGGGPMTIFFGAEGKSVGR